MDIHIPPPEVALWIVVAAPAIVAIFTLPRTRIPLPQRVIPLVVSVLASTAVAVFLAAPHSFGWDAQGIRDQSFGTPETIAWAEVTAPEVVADLMASPYCPTRRTGGSAYERFRAGEWSLTNGERARIYVEVPATQALVFRTHGRLHVYAPAHVDDLVATARAHCPALHAPTP